MVFVVVVVAVAVAVAIVVVVVVVAAAAALVVALMICLSKPAGGWWSEICAGRQLLLGALRINRTCDDDDC